MTISGGTTEQHALALRVISSVSFVEHIRFFHGALHITVNSGEVLRSAWCSAPRRPRVALV